MSSRSPFSRLPPVPERPSLGKFTFLTKNQNLYRNKDDFKKKIVFFSSKINYFLCEFCTEGREISPILSSPVTSPPRLLSPPLSPPLSNNYPTFSATSPLLDDTLVDSSVDEEDSFGMISGTDRWIAWQTDIVKTNRRKA